jgi:hypothetical protein
LQLPDSNIDSYFLKSFGRPERVITCECERTAQPSMVQVLHLANGSALNDKLAAKGNLIEKLLSAGATDEQIVEELFLAALARYPSVSQKRKTLEELRAAKDDRRAGIEDLFWGLLSSKEFVFNH